MDNVIFLIENIRQMVVGFFHSSFFLTVRTIIGIYTLVLFLDIILLIIQRGVAGNMREKFLGMDAPRAVLDKKEKTREKWEAIRKRAESSSPVDYKIAVIEADDFIDEIIKGFKYAGNNFGERLDNIPHEHIVNVAGMKQAHQIRNKIIHDDNFVLSQSDCFGVLGQYEEFLRSFHIID